MGQDPGQGGDPPGPAAPHLRGEAAGGRPHARGLQHPEGEHAAPGAAPARGDHRAFPAHPGQEAQLRQADLPQVSLPSSLPCPPPCPPPPPPPPPPPAPPPWELERGRETERGEDGGG